MGVGAVEPEAPALDLWRIGILLVSVALSAYHLSWGLPNGNDSWAADALGPVTVLGVVSRSFRQWNSGWFYFKYPLGYPLLQAAVYVPYLAYLFVAGGWRVSSSAYPYGFANPEQALFVLALCGRMLSVLLTVGTVALTYAIGERLFGRLGGRLSAWLVATCYPVIYYAHTTNLDAAYLFWLILALYCAVVASQTDRWLPWAGLGVAAAMAVSTKEQGFAFLLPLPALALLARIRAHGTVRVCWAPATLAMAGAAIGTAILANNVLVNPLGFVGRLAYLLGHPLQPVTARLAPVEFALWKGAQEWKYVRQLWDGLDSALGTPLACLAAAGAVAVWRTPRTALWLLAPVVIHYYVALRGLDLIALRYLLPLIVVAAVLASGLLARLYAGAGHGWGRAAVLAVCCLLAAVSLARAFELHWLLHTDSRYQAERWMRAHLASGAHGEVYQKPAYVPRFGTPVTAEWVPMPGRTIAAVRERGPDFIVISSASRRSITHIWNPDWRETRSLLLPAPEAVRLFAALQSGDLGYRPAARFRQTPRLLRSGITSLCPEITIYVHDPR